MKAVDDDLVTLAVIAKLFSDGMSNADVAKLLGLRDDRVMNLRVKAEREGFLRIKREFVEAEVRKRRIVADFKNRLGETDLSKQLEQLRWRGKCSFSAVHSSEAEQFERRAAERLGSLIVSTGKITTIGLMWGGVIENVLSHLDGYFQKKARPKHRIRCIPLCGEPIGVMRNSMPRYSSSYLAAELQRILSPAASRSSQDDEQFLLGAVPAYFPVAARLATKGFLNIVPGHVRIFNPNDGLINDLHLAITGLGTFDPSGVSDISADSMTGIFLRERIVLEKPAQPGISQEIRECAVGDVGGCIAPKSNLSPQQRMFVRSLNEGWTGASEDHLKKCAARSLQAPVKTRKPGVIAIARGAHKAAIVEYAVRHELVSEVICDLTLSKALLSLP